MLNSKEKAQLKKEAHNLKATFQVGALEIHRNIILAIYDTFNTKELVKVKVNRIDRLDKEIVKEIAKKLTANNSIEIVDITGTTITLYRKKKDK